MIREAIRATVRGVGVLLLTAVEVTALSVWLGLVRDVPALSSAAVVGVAALTAGTLVAGLLVHVTVNGWGRPVPSRAVAGLAVGETVLWVGWLAAVRWLDGPGGVVLAGLGLAAGLVVRFTVADNAVRGRPALASVVQRATIAPAVVKAAGATAWLLVVTRAVAVPQAVAPPVAGFSANAIVGGFLLGGTAFATNLLAVRHALRPTRQSNAGKWNSSGKTLRE